MERQEKVGTWPALAVKRSQKKVRCYAYFHAFIWLSKNTFFYIFGTIVESLFFSSVDLNLDNVKKFYYLDKNGSTLTKQILATGQKNIEIYKHIYPPPRIFYKRFITRVERIFMNRLINEILLCPSYRRFYTGCHIISNTWIEIQSKVKTPYRVFQNFIFWDLHFY